MDLPPDNTVPSPQTLHNTAPYSDLWKHVAIALQRLSVRTGLFPSIYELRGVKKLEQEAVSEGRCGEVYPGEYKGEMVCIRVLRINAKDRKRIMKLYAREAILWAQLSHQNILPFYGVCTLDSRPCLVSLWAANGNVIEYLQKNPHADRLALVQDVAEGLRYLHSLEIVHGDLKGANVLVDLEGFACLADFGISSVYDRGVLDWTPQPAAVSTGGRVRWQAPELLQEAARNTKQSDMYSWACTVYEIFTGDVPYAATTNFSLVYLKKMQGVSPCCPSRRTRAWTKAGLDDSIWNLLNDCWNCQPETRPTIEEAIFQTRQPLGKNGRRYKREKRRFSPPERQAVNTMATTLENKEAYRSLLQDPDPHAQGVLDMFSARLSIYNFSFFFVLGVSLFYNIL